MNLMLKSVYAEQDGKPLPILVDLGEWSELVAQRYECMRAWLPRRRFQFVGYGERVFAEIPPRKLKKILGIFPQIVEGCTYWRSTHHWQDGADA